MRFAPLTIVLVLALVNAGCLGGMGGGGGDGRTVVVLAIQPTENPASITDKAAALEAFLEDRTGFDVQIRVPLTNTGVIEALNFEFADLAFLSAWPSLLAAERAGAHIGLAEKREVLIDGTTQVQPYYFSYYVVKKDSPIQTLADLRGKRVAFPSSTSTSGYVFPLAKLVDEGLATKPASGEFEPKTFFGTVLLAGGYKQAWEALNNGQVDASVIAGDVSASLYYEVLNNTRVIATQGPVPSHGVVFAKGLDAGVESKLVQALLELKGENRALMRSLVSAIFVEFVETTTANHTGPLDDALGKLGLRFTDKLA